MSLGQNRCVNVNVWYKNENNKNTDHVYPFMFTNTTPGGTAVKRSFLVNDVTEFTGNLKPTCEWCFSGKKTERCYLCERHIFEFTGKVVPVILWQFTGITVWKGLMIWHNFPLTYICMCNQRHLLITTYVCPIIRAILLSKTVQCYSTPPIKTKSHIFL